MTRVTLDEFLAPISKRLGHVQVPQNVKPFDYQNEAPARSTDGLSQVHLVDKFAEEAEKIHIDVQLCAPEEAARIVVEIVGKAYAEDPVCAEAGLYSDAVGVVFADDHRIDSLGIPKALEELAADRAGSGKESSAELSPVVPARWDSSASLDQMAALCTGSRFGITFAQGGIAETATIVQMCSAKCGRSISLLPLEHIALVNASSIKGTMGDWLKEFDGMCNGSSHSDMPSQICFISGPSATADIELVRVEGVHGPMFVHYIIIEN